MAFDLSSISLPIAIVLSLLITFYGELEITRGQWFIWMAFAAMVMAINLLVLKDQGNTLLAVAVFLCAVAHRPFTQFTTH